MNIYAVFLSIFYVSQPVFLSSKDGFMLNVRNGLEFFYSIKRYSIDGNYLDFHVIHLNILWPTKSLPI